MKETDEKHLETPALIGDKVWWKASETTLELCTVSKIDASTDGTRLQLDRGKKRGVWVDIEDWHKTFHSSVVTMASHIE